MLTSNPCAQVAWGIDHRIILDFPLLINCAPPTLTPWTSSGNDDVAGAAVSLALS